MTERERLVRCHDIDPMGCRRARHRFHDGVWWHSAHIGPWDAILQIDAVTSSTGDFQITKFSKVQATNGRS